MADPKQMTNWVDAKANKKIRQLFGQQYVFHDTRAMYAQLAYISYAPPGMPQTYFTRKFWGIKRIVFRQHSRTRHLRFEGNYKEDDPDLTARMTKMEIQLQELKNVQMQMQMYRKMQVRMKMPVEGWFQSKTNKELY